MTKTLNAIFDGKVLHPEEPIGLEPDTRVRVTIETSEPLKKKDSSFLRTAQSLKIEGPSDWSGRFEEYLYGNGNGVE